MWVRTETRPSQILLPIPQYVVRKAVRVRNPALTLLYLEVRAERFYRLVGLEKEASGMREAKGDVRHCAIVETHQQFGDAVAVAFREAVFGRLEEQQNQIQRWYRVDGIDDFLRVDLVLVHAVRVTYSRRVDHNNLVLVRQETKSFIRNGKTSINRNFPTFYPSLGSICTVCVDVLDAPDTN